MRTSPQSAVVSSIDAQPGPSKNPPMSRPTPPSRQRWRGTVEKAAWLKRPHGGFASPATCHAGFLHRLRRSVPTGRPSPGAVPTYRLSTSASEKRCCFRVDAASSTGSERAPVGAPNRGSQAAPGKAGGGDQPIRVGPGESS